MERKHQARKPPSGNTRERLLNEACRIFAERGYRNTRIQEICAAANANIAAVNYHFGGKEGLYKAVWDHALEHAVAEDAAISGPLSADADREWLYEYVRACVRSVFDTGTGGFLRRLMANEAVDPSPVSEEVLAEHLAPRRTELAARLRRMLGPDATAWQIGCCVFAINSQFTALALNRAVRRAIFRNDAPTEAEAEHFVREICAFTMGGIRALRAVPRRPASESASPGAATNSGAARSGTARNGAAAAMKAGAKAGVLAALALLLAPPAVAAPSPTPSRPASPLEALRRAEASRTASSNGSVAVSGEAFTYADRSVILGFVEDFRTALEKELFGTSGPVPGPNSFRTDDYRILVRSDAPDAPASLRSSLLPRVVGEPPHTSLIVSVSGPVSELDSHALGVEIADGLLRLRVLAAARDAIAAGVPSAAAARPRPFPRWFALGLARLTDTALRQSDYDEVAAKAAVGSLPPLAELIAADSPAACSDPAIAAQLVAFWLSRPDRQARFAAIGGALASGVPWSPSLFLLHGIGVESEERGADAFAKFMKERAGKVLTPGSTSAAGAEALLASLRLVPGRDGVPQGAAAPSASTLPPSGSPRGADALSETGQGASFLPPEAIFLPENADWARPVAAALERRVRVAAAGRGAAWGEACDNLADIFAAVASGNPPRDAPAQFKAAELALLATAAEAEDANTATTASTKHVNQ